MKKMLLVLMILCICSSVYAKDMYTAIDNEARVITKPFLDTLKDGLKDKDLVIISTGARAMIDADDVVYLCWIETTDGYYYYEMTIKSINDNEQLLKKYSLD